MKLSPDQAGPERLYRKTYLRLIRNSVGTEMFRNFYVRTPEKGEFDAMDDGRNSCAFFVSGILALFKKVNGVHGTVSSTQRDLKESGWQLINENNMQEGDVLVWKAMPFEDGTYEHIGFYVGNTRAISASWTERKVVEHDVHFEELNRPITHVFRMSSW